MSSAAQPRPGRTRSTVNTLNPADPAPGTNKTQHRPDPAPEKPPGNETGRHTEKSPYTAGKQ
ncbi:MAG: hypothetical protein KF796_11740 [Ramlibacter sp.]|nr:hypothetical protein [Ramlibacter sp.]